MKILHPKSNLTVSIDGRDVDLKSKFQYIFPEPLVTELTGNGGIQAFDVKPFVNEKEPPEGVDYTGKRILTSRMDGIGDFFFVARSILEIKNKFEGVRVTFASQPRHRVTLSIFDRILDRIVALPLPYKEYEDCDYFVTFENFVEANPDTMTKNIYDLIANKKFYVSIDADHSVPIRVNNGAKMQAAEASKDWERPVIGIQTTATAVMRTWPLPYIHSLINRLDAMGYDALLLDSEESIKNLLSVSYMADVKDKIKLPFFRGFSSLELSIALVEKCSAIVAPDSAFVYIADSLGIPVLGLYGPFASQLRSKGLNVHALEVLGKCHNCQTHTPLPCLKSDDEYSPCLKAITPEVVVSALKMIGEVKK